MSQGKEHIDKLIQEKLHAAETTPPASVWDSIESSLDKKQKRSAIALYRWLGSAAAILLLGFLALYLVRSERKVQAVQEKLTQELIKDSIIEKDTLFTDNPEDKTQKEKQKGDTKNTISALAVVEKEAILQRESQHKTTKQKEKSPLISSSLVYRKNKMILSLNRLEQGEISSLYKQKANPLIAIKSNLLKRIVEADDLSIQLAELSSKPDKKAWSLGLAFAPTSVGRFSGFSTLDYGTLYADAGSTANSEMNLVTEKDLPAYSGGVNLVYELSERWSFQSGVYYLKQGQRIENFSIVQNSALDYLSSNANNLTSNSYFGNIVFDNYTLLSENAQVADFVQVSDEISYSSYNNDLLQQFELIEIPLVANYKIINKKIVFSVTAGINSGIIVGNNVYLAEYSSKAVGKTESINTLIYKSVFGLNLQYPLSRKLYFNLSPTFKYQLNNFNKNAVVSEQLRYLEFKTGLNYRF